MQKITGIKSTIKGINICMETERNKLREKFPLINVLLIGIEETGIQNRYDKIKMKGIDKNNHEIEYFMVPATMVNLTYMVTPYSDKHAETCRMMGALVKLFKDDYLIEVDGFDWVENEGNPVLIEASSPLPLPEQIRVFSAMNLDYRPSLFYRLRLGIDSGKQEVFRRVKERKFETVKKPEN
ncbi:MAG: DUF4255 domain-containing protein [Spirochaetales bacterium]|nr:DUF4255 domain-containing protein [Spirochaetales bacterium]